jgi:hypothetical protein
LIFIAYLYSCKGKIKMRSKCNIKQLTRKACFCIINMLFIGELFCLVKRGCTLITLVAGVAELADAQDLKSCGLNRPYRFDSGRRHEL